MAVLELTTEQIYRLVTQLTPNQKQELVKKLTAPEPPLLQPRVPGCDKGKVWVSQDFNKPLPAEIEESFYT